MGVLADVRRVWRSEGPAAVVLKAFASLHRRIRPYVPEKDYTVMNGVKVREPEYENSKFFDEIVPWPVHRSDYKGANVAGIRENADPGDDVIIIGGGFGVTTAVAAEQVGPNGLVRSYEASPERADKVRRTVESNRLADRCEVVEAVVGRANVVAGQADEKTIEETHQRATQLSPSELPDCDLLEMDCEGAELTILRELSHRPRTIVVESHPERGVSDQALETELQEMGYEVTAMNQRENGSVFWAHDERSV